MVAEVKKVDLILHCGALRVEVDRVHESATPPRTRTWTPVPHGRFLDQVRRTLVRSGLSVIHESHALSHEDRRYFGLLQLQNGDNRDDYGLVVGLRNAHDKSFCASLAAGAGVFVCDNLSFSGEITIARKHTRFISRDLPQLIDVAVGRLGDLRRTQDQRFEAYKATRLPDARAHDVVIQALDARIIPSTAIPKVLKEWREPRHQEFKPRNAWSLFNAFTEVAKDRNVFERPRETQALHGLLDSVCGVASSSN